MTDCDWHDGGMEQDLVNLGQQVVRARLQRGWSKEQAAREAGISSITWKRIEDGQGVQDAKRYAALRAVGLVRDEADTPYARMAAEVEAGIMSESTKKYVLEQLKALEEKASESRKQTG